MKSNKSLRPNDTMVMCALSVLAAISVTLFFWCGPSDMHYTITEDHAMVGFSLAKYNDIWVDAAIVEHVRKDGLQGSTQSLQNLRSAGLVQLEGKRLPFPINDTIGYGVLLGLLWKITGSLSVLDAQLLQMILYILSLWFVYQIALIFFTHRIKALLSVLMLILFFPLTALVVQPVRDVWAYYATVILLWGVLQFMQRRAAWYVLAVTGFFFALFQWIRPTAFLVLCTMSIGLLFFAFMRQYTWRRVLACGGLLFVTNIIIFWIPFLAYNLITYHRLLVGPAGQDLIESLGEFENPWGFQLSDEFVSNYIGEKYGLQMGTPEFDDKARDEFRNAYAQAPSVYWKHMIRRMPQWVLPGLPWLFLKKSPYEGLIGWKAKLAAAFSSISMLIDFVLRHVLIRLFLLAGCFGMLLAWRRGNHLAVLFSLAIILGGLGKLPSHIECRYLVPFYWPIALFVAQLFHFKQFNFKN